MWLAYNAGAEAWAACLQALESKLAKAAFENLSRVPPLERAKVSCPTRRRCCAWCPKPPLRPSEAGLDQLEAEFSRKIVGCLKSNSAACLVKQMLTRANRSFLILAAMDPDGDHAA